MGGARTDPGGLEAGGRETKEGSSWQCSRSSGSLAEWVCGQRWGTDLSEMLLCVLECYSTAGMCLKLFS